LNPPLNSVEFHPDGFGRLKHPCLQTSVEILSGASGGPVIDSAGRIFAVNSTSFDLNDGGEPVSFVTPIAPLLDVVFKVVPEQIQCIAVDSCICCACIQNHFQLILVINFNIYKYEAAF
jgi:hypothetical protein